MGNFTNNNLIAQSMKKSILVKGSTLGGLAVIFGAFGAHALKNILTPEQLISFETGVKYQMYHGVVLLFIFLMYQKFQHKYLLVTSKLMFVGTVAFSGSIYLLTLKNWLGIEALKYIAPITPVGGGLIIVGWLFLLLSAFQLKK
ncbi:MAG TPA: DUF423 domain-containing protein [Vicingaceae bacterium]|nr:DUF423 domain-containing protein [Vicingaceae bacterium]